MQERFSAADQEQALAAIAPYYDLDFGGLDEDIALYLEFARRTDGPVLELGAGTGRVAAALADAGWAVSAVESSPAMLAAGRARLQEAGVRVIQADIRDVRLDERYGLVIVALSTFRHLLTRADQERATATIAAHLAPGGIAILDLQRPAPEDFHEEAQPLRLEWTRTHPERGVPVMKLSTQERDPAGDWVWLTYIYDEVREGGALHRSLARFPLRVGPLPDEITALARGAGLRVEAMYGSYDLDPVGAGDRLIVVAALAESAS